MLRVMSCLVYEHDYAFLWTAVIVCIGSAVMTIGLLERARKHSGTLHFAWILAAALACGGTIWATHFVAMLGFRLPAEYAFNPVHTVLSLILAIAFSGSSIYLVTARYKELPGELGGIVLGIGIVVMHFTGMAGLELSGHVEWDWMLVAASILFAITLGALTTHIVTRRTFRHRNIAAMASLVLAICTMHFIAMGAATLIPDPSVPISPLAMSGKLLTTMVLAAIVAIGGLAFYVLDSRSQYELIDGFRYAATHDPLTGLPNRAYVTENLGRFLAEARSQGTTMAILALDLDRFKQINDEHGHDAGDHFLKTIAQRFKNTLLPGEIIARIGGDEFIVVKRHLHTIGETEALAKRVRQCIVEPVSYGGTLLRADTSIGVSLAPGGTNDEEGLLRGADIALDRAKQSPTEYICYFEPGMDERRRKRNALAAELVHAVERNQLQMRYLPIIDLSTGAVSGYEVSVRWKKNDNDLVSQAEFISIAEETGLTATIGEWALRGSCAEIAQRPKPCRIAINLAPAQISEGDLPDVVSQVLAETKLPAELLELNITEAMILAEKDRTLRILHALRDIGVKIVLADFGAGETSMKTLRIFPFNKVTINRSAISSVTSSPVSSAVVRATIILASSLNIPVLAEGVETLEQLEFLRKEGCTQARGILFDQTMPRDNISTRVVKSSSPNPSITPEFSAG